VSLLIGDWVRARYFFFVLVGKLESLWSVTQLLNCAGKCIVGSSYFISPIVFMCSVA
jgi:hypothetical protein